MTEDDDEYGYLNELERAYLASGGDMPWWTWIMLLGMAMGVIAMAGVLL